MQIGGLEGHGAFIGSPFLVAIIQKEFGELGGSLSNFLNP